MKTLIMTAAAAALFAVPALASLPTDKADFEALSSPITDTLAFENLAPVNQAAMSTEFPNAKHETVANVLVRGNMSNERDYSFQQGAMR